MVISLLKLTNFIFLCHGIETRPRQFLKELKYFISETALRFSERVRNLKPRSPSSSQSVHLKSYCYTFTMTSDNGHAETSTGRGLGSSDSIQERAGVSLGITFIFLRGTKVRKRSSSRRNRIRKVRSSEELFDEVFEII